MCLQFRYKNIKVLFLAKMALMCSILEKLCSSAQHIQYPTTKQQEIVFMDYNLLRNIASRTKTIKNKAKENKVTYMKMKMTAAVEARCYTAAAAVVKNFELWETKWGRRSGRKKMGETKWVFWAK